MVFNDNASYSSHSTQQIFQYLLIKVDKKMTWSANIHFLLQSKENGC